MSQPAGRASSRALSTTAVVDAKRCGGQEFRVIRLAFWRKPGSSLVQYLPGFPLFQPVGRLVHQLGRHTLLLIALPGHRTQLRPERAQPLGRPLLLHARLVTQLVLRLAGEIAGLGTVSRTTSVVCSLAVCATRPPASAAPWPTFAACSRTAWLVDPDPLEGPEASSRPPLVLPADYRVGGYAGKTGHQSGSIRWPPAGSTRQSTLDRLGA